MDAGTEESVRTKGSNARQARRSTYRPEFVSERVGNAKAALAAKVHGPDWRLMGRCCLSGNLTGIDSLKAL